MGAYVKHKWISLFAIYFTYFVDNLSWAIVFPIFAPYFLNPTILGLFLMAFSLGQFFGSPLIGEYADKYGRRRVLLWSVFFTLVGLSLSAWSMNARYLSLLFVSRFITGIFASSTTICLSALSDLSENARAKVEKFGSLSMLTGISFVIGAFIGGKLSDKTLYPLFHPAFPLWIASGLTLLNFLFIFFGFKETSQINKSVKFHFWQAFNNIRMALKIKNLKQLYLIYFLFIFAWTILFQFAPVLAVKKFGFTSSDIGNMALFMGLFWAIGSNSNRLLARYFKIHVLLEFCLVGFSIFCACIIFPKNLYAVFLILGLCVLIGAIAWPLCTGLISNTGSSTQQGKVLGLSQSIQSFAMAMAPLFAGFAAHFSLQLSFILAAAISFLAVGLYFVNIKTHEP